MLIIVILAYTTEPPGKVCWFSTRIELAVLLEPAIAGPHKIAKLLNLTHGMR